MEYVKIVRMMTANESKKNFKIVAIRILPGCAEHIKKCLHENEFYYLCNDYRINDDGNKIVLASKNLKPLDEDFFWTDDNHDGPRINLSAIVGMNGDGKSSLIEVFLRLINNFSEHYQFNPNQGLRHVDGVCAECYYKLNGNFYRLREKHQNGDGAIQVHNYEEKDSEYHLGKEVEGLSKEFFYTLVSNYSLYAYNVDDFHKEFSDKDENCWLYNVFNKNDGYQVPLSLHPYRDSGNIDINNENDLARQSLLSVYLQYKAEGLVKDKKPEAVRLEDVGYSKLQENTFLKYFDNRTEYDNLLDGKIASLTNILNNKNINSDEKDIVKDIYGFLNDFYNIFIATRRELIEEYHQWCFNRGKLNSTPISDISKMIDLLNDINQKFSLNNKILYEARWNIMQDFNMCQILHIIYIDEVHELLINELLKLDVNLKPKDYFFVDYASMSEELKCRHYILYKTVKIFETKHKNPEELFFWMFQYDDSSKHVKLSKPSWLDNLFEDLKKDWENKSHITLKLRQTYSHLLRIQAKKYKNRKNVEPIWKSDEDISICELKKSYSKVLADLENMPPAIYKWDIWFKYEGQSERIPFSSFSSGEKQKLHNIGAIVYHLNNINTSSGLIHYDAVNIILEENELYFHPEWQRSLIYDLTKMIRQTELNNIKSINILFVTHSPYILSDIPKTNVLFLKDGRPNYNMQENTFGANINSLLKNGFFMPGLPIGEFAHRKINSIFSKLHSGDFNDEELKKLKQDILLVGEPFIRQQLMTLYNTYTEFNKDAIAKMITSYEKNQNNND